MNLSVVIASSGRETLGRAIESARSQMQVGDEILVSVNADCPWGHKARNYLMKAARGDYLLFMDDDDAYVPGAFDVVRAAVEQDDHATGERMHIFRMQYGNGTRLWVDPQVRLGNVSTQMVVVPWIAPRLAGCRWNEEKYEGDYYFISACAERLEVAWHEEVIALVRP